MEHSSLLLDVLKFVIIENVDCVIRSQGWQDALSHNHSLVTFLFQLLGHQLAASGGSDSSSRTTEPKVNGVCS